MGPVDVNGSVYTARKQHQRICPYICVLASSDEYANRIPNPEHTPKYTKVKVPCTQDKQCISRAASQSYATAAAAL